MTDGLPTYSSIQAGKITKYGATDVPELAPWWKRPRRSGERPRIFIIGPQHSKEAFDQAAAALQRHGYQGTWLRLAPVLFTQEPDGDELSGHLDNDGFVPDEFWKREVRARMRHCDGVAVLHADEAAAATILWEKRMARRLGKPVHPLEHWLRSTSPR